jgi:pimeloyl-ACP methyl ester carboxylesterase
MNAPDCERAFLRLREGLLHYRHAGPAPTADWVAGAGVGPAAGGQRPLWMMHASPASSRSLEPLALELAQRHGRHVFAPDTPGNGDSAPLAIADPELGDYADAFVRAMDVLRIERTDLYGFHTGAHIAIEMALAHPDRIGGLVLDGLLWLEDAERDEFLAQYAPPLRPDANGTQVFTALQFIRDQAWFFPHFRRDPAHNLGGGAMPPALLHMLTVDLLKAAETYHLAYRAVFRHRLEARLLRLGAQPVLLMADASDPTRHAVARAAAIVPGARSTVLAESWSPAGLADKAAQVVRFLDAGAAPAR